jgi:VanZ family protein
LDLSSSKERRIWLIAYAPLIVWIIVVLGLGTGIGSMNETSRFIRPLLEFLFPDASPAKLLQYHGYIRKLAHFAEYAILAFFAYRAFKVRRPFVLAILLVAAVAIADEMNQSFSSSRTASPNDVLLDVIGGASTLFLIWLASRVKRSN